MAISRITFRLRIDANVVAQRVTAAQVRLLVGELLDRVTLPKRDDRASVHSVPLSGQRVLRETGDILSPRISIPALMRLHGAAKRG
jgi:hypothetical protein